MRKCHQNAIAKAVAESNSKLVSSLETRFRSSQGQDQLELFPVEQKTSNWLWLIPLTIILALVATVSFATELPKMPEGGLTILSKAKCTDNETGQRGLCYNTEDKDGNFYLIFFQDDDMPMFIRKALGNGKYETLYVSDKFNST